MNGNSTQKAEAEFRRLMMARSPEERLIMACRMFSTAKALVAAGIRQQHGDLPPHEMRKRIFLRLYGQDFPEDQLQAIVKSLSG